MSNNELMRILLAEDDDNDIRITRRAIQKAGLSAVLDTACDGQEALDYLRHENSFISTTRPDLVLLDINLPRINGVNVLRQIKQTPELKTIPVLMLTTSARQEDVNAAYSHGANGFICKPLRFAEFVDVIRNMSLYWGHLAVIPEHPN